MGAPPTTTRRPLHPVAAGATGAVIIAFSAVMVRLADVSPATAAVFRCAYALPLLGAIAVWQSRRDVAGGEPGRSSSSTRVRPWFAVVAGLCFAVDLVAWHTSIAAVGAGLATVLANVQVVLVAVVAFVVLAERPARRELVAIPLVMAGIVLVSGAVGARSWGDDPTLGVATGLVTAVAYTGFLLALRHAAPEPRHQVQALTIATAVAGAGSVVLGYALGDMSLVPEWPSHGWLFLLAVTCQVIAWILIARSMGELRAATASLVLTIQPLGSLLLGMALLGERPSHVQLAGCAAIIAAMLIGVRSTGAPVGPVRPIDL